MSRLFPSEVARLVLGYLREKGCHRAHDEFLRESPDLNEFRSCLIGPNTYDYPTSVNGKSLVQHLNNTGTSTVTPIPQNSHPLPQQMFTTNQPAPVIAQALPIITTTLPFIATPVPAPVAPAVTAISQKTIEQLKKIQADQVTLTALNSQMNQFARKTKSVSDKRTSSTKSQQQQQPNQKVQSNQKQQPASQAVVQVVVTPDIRINESQPPAESFKTPVKQIVRRTRHGYVTPNGATGVSPKKATPRKSLTPRKLTPGKSSGTMSTSSYSSDRDSTLTPSKINSNNIHVEPEKVVEKFISNPSMPNLLAEEINKIWKNYNESGIQTLVSGDICILDSAIQTPTKSAPKSATKPDHQAENAPVDQMVNTVMKELEQHTSINQFIDEFAANECMGISAFSDLDCLLPFGSESSPFSSYDSTPVHSVGDEDGHNPGSLTTPKSDFREQPIASSSHCAAASSAVKNLMQDLKTPEKKVPSPFNSSPFAVRRSGSPVCIVIPDDCGGSQLPLPQLVEQADPVMQSQSPLKKLRKIAPASERSQGKHHVPVQDIPCTIRIRGSAASRLTSASVSELREVQRKMHSVPGKSVKDGGRR